MLKYNAYIKKLILCPRAIFFFIIIITIPYIQPIFSSSSWDSLWQ